MCYKGYIFRDPTAVDALPSPILPHTQSGTHEKMRYSIAKTGLGK